MSKRRYEKRYIATAPYWDGPRVRVLETGVVGLVRETLRELRPVDKFLYGVVIGEPPVYPLDVIPPCEIGEHRTGEVIFDDDGNVIGVSYPYLAEWKFYEASELDFEVKA